MKNIEINAILTFYKWLNNQCLSKENEFKTGMECSECYLRMFCFVPPEERTPHLVKMAISYLETEQDSEPFRAHKNKGHRIQTSHYSGSDHSPDPEKVRGKE